MYVCILRKVGCHYYNYNLSNQIFHIFPNKHYTRNCLKDYIIIWQPVSVVKCASVIPNPSLIQEPGFLSPYEEVGKPATPLPGAFIFAISSSPDTLLI